MPNPSAIYIVTYSGTQLPGYVQGEDLPLFIKNAASEILGRDGGTQARRGAAMRDVSLTFRVLSRLGAGSTGLQHLDDCMDQWRSGLNTCIDMEGSAELKVGDTDRHLNAEFISSTAPLQAGTPTRMTYTMTFKASPPYFLGTTVSGSETVSGNTTITVNIGDTRRTYPIITVPSGITHITLSGVGTGKAFTLSGSHTSPWVVDCATLQITEAGSNAVSFLTSGPDFGISHKGSGSLVLSSSSVTGSGTVEVTLQPRYAR